MSDTTTAYEGVYQIHDIANKLIARYPQAEDTDAMCKEIEAMLDTFRAVVIKHSKQFESGSWLVDESRRGSVRLAFTPSYGRPVITRPPVSK